MHVASSHSGWLALCTLLLMFATNTTLQAQVTRGSVASQATAVKNLPLTEPDRQRYIGVYTVKPDGPSPRSMRLRIFEEKSVLMGQMDENVPTPMLYQGNHAFRPEAAQVFVVTFNLENGRATAVSMVSPEGTMNGVRVETAEGRGENANADETSSGALYDELARLDSLLFDAFFVKCDAQMTNSFFTDDLEFYHDLTGLKSGQTARDSFRQCPRDNGGTRMLVPGSMRVYPIKDYGAIQIGVHRFGQTEAKFVHLWRKKNGEWKITRVLSFDHRAKSP
jgi:hypothetical protein